MRIPRPLFLRSDDDLALDEQPFPIGLFLEDILIMPRAADLGIPRTLGFGIQAGPVAVIGCPGRAFELDMTRIGKMP